MKVSLEQISWTSYTFNAAAWTVTISWLSFTLKPSNIRWIINASKNKVIYQIDEPRLWLKNLASNTITLNYNTQLAGMSNSDSLSIWLDVYVNETQYVPYVWATEDVYLWSRSLSALWLTWSNIVFTSSLSSTHCYFTLDSDVEDAIFETTTVIVNVDIDWYFIWWINTAPFPQEQWLHFFIMWWWKGSFWLKHMSSWSTYKIFLPWWQDIVINEWDWIHLYYDIGQTYFRVIWIARVNGWGGGWWLTYQAINSSQPIVTWNLYWIDANSWYIQLTLGDWSVVGDRLCVVKEDETDNEIDVFASSINWDAKITISEPWESYDLYRTWSRFIIT